MTAVSATPREMVCFAPKPITATLTWTRRLVWNVLHNAKGFLAAGGMTTREIACSIERMRDTYALINPNLPPFDYARTVRRVRRALAYLAAIGKAERVIVTREVEGRSDVSQPSRWRKA